MSKIKIGFGYDLHKLCKGSSLTLAGVTISSEYSIDAHSDGDIILHALSDAIYGSLAMGDIGIHFPSDSSNQNISSKIILSHACNLLQQEMYSLSNIDITVILEKPRLQENILKMRENLSKLTSINLDNISIKSSTSQKIGLIGNHKAIACYASILISKD